MVAWSKQISKNLAANTEQHFCNTPRTSLDHIWSSILNDKLTATLPRCYSTIDRQSVIVLRHHTSKLSTISWQTWGILWGTGGQKNILEALKLKNFLYHRERTWSYPVSRAQDLVIFFDKIADTWLAHGFSFFFELAPYTAIRNIKPYSKNANMYYQTPMLSKWRLCYLESQSIGRTASDNLT